MSKQKIKSVNQVQILDKVAYIFLSSNALCKVKSLSFSFSQGIFFVQTSF